ncbi:MAG: hypothetical protein Q9191_000904 [Dirinaria sp. TL-2023a]
MAQGIATDFWVDELRSHPVGHPTYFAFQLKKPVSVRIHDPEEGPNRVECSCGDNSTCCVHIYWLFDALKAVLTNQRSPTVRAVSQADIIAEICSLYDSIGDRMSELPDRINALRGSESDSDDDEPSEAMTSRQLALADILSIFDPAALPHEYGREISAAMARTPADQLLVEGSLGATIYRMAVRDDAFYKYLIRVADADTCAQHYFSKQLRRAQRAMMELDRYSATGPSDDVQIQDMDVGQCARDLRRIVSEICEEREARLSKGPLSANTRKRIAESLVRILDGVLNRNREIYGDNLYTSLISEPPRPVTDQEQRDFVIDDLRTFPSTEWIHLTEVLERIAGRVQRNALHDHHPSMQYAEKIEEMIHDADDSFEREASFSPVRQPRRPTLGEERESQRPRIS